MTMTATTTHSPQRATILLFTMLVGIAASAVGAQVTVKAVTRTKITVDAVAGAPDSKSIAANTDVSGGFSIAVWSLIKNQCSANASSLLTKSKIFGGQNVELRNNVNANFKSTCGPVSARAGSNEVLVTLTSASPVAGRLILTVQGGHVSNGVSSFGSIDVGADGSTELTSGQTSLDVVVGPKGLPVILRGFAKTTVSRGAVSIAAVLFLPTGGRFRVIGAPCRQGPVFEAFYTGTLLQLQASKIPAGPYALIAIGTRDPKLKLPPLGCALLTDVVIPVGITVRGGEAQLRVPVTVPRGTFRMQFLISTSHGWITSNGLSITSR